MKINLIYLLLFTTIFELNAQKWSESLFRQVKTCDLISQSDLSWKIIYKKSRNELGIKNKYLIDIKNTIKYLDTINLENQIDSFFVDICETRYTRFPFKSSGNLSNDLYVIPPKPIENDSLNISVDSIHILLNPNYRNLYPKVAELTKLNKNEIIPILIKYLDNDAATRLIVDYRGIDDYVPFYLSISDVAMELLEIITLCDFYDNASQSYLLFSNIELTKKSQIKSVIKKWYQNSTKLSQFEAVKYFLDSICDLGHSYRYTCHNLLFCGDTIGAKTMYTKLYERTEVPCGINFEVGEILLKLGDRRILNDCSNKIYNYRCSSGENCIDILFNSEEAWFRDDVFAEIIATERYSTYRRGNRKTFIWHSIFGMLPNNIEKNLIKSLVELMKIKDKVSSLNKRYTEEWKNKYPKEFESDYRVCDFAMIMYIETIEEIVKLTYGSIDEKNKMTEILKKVKTLNRDNINERNKMIEIIKEYED